jgi:hypothetical protein
MLEIKDNLDKGWTTYVQLYFQEILKCFASVGAHVVAVLLRRQRINKIFDKHLFCRKPWRPKCRRKGHIKIKIIRYADTDVSWVELSTKGMVMVIKTQDT